MILLKCNILPFYEVCIKRILFTILKIPLWVKVKLFMLFSVFFSLCFTNFVHNGTSLKKTKNVKCLRVLNTIPSKTFWVTRKVLLPDNFLITFNKFLTFFESVFIKIDLSLVRISRNIEGTILPWKQQQKK